LRDSISSFVMRSLFPSYAAHVAERVLREDSVAGNAPPLAAADQALLSGHPAGSSRRRAADRLDSEIWDLCPAHVALLDGDGLVVSVNRSWRQFGRQSGGDSAGGVGRNYLEICARAAAEGEPEAAEAARVIRSVLAGVRSDIRIRYRVADDRWFEMEAFPLPGRGAGALVVHTDITAEWTRDQTWRHRALILDRLAAAAAADDRIPMRPRRGTGRGRGLAAAR
jgi:PAS domain-containing protein